MLAVLAHHAEAAPGSASQAASRREACDAPTHQQVLRPAAAGSAVAGAGTAAQGIRIAEARAVAMDALHLRWPGADGALRTRLLQADAGGIVAVPGQPATGAQRAVALWRVERFSGTDPRERIRWVGAGPDYAVPTEWRSPQALRRLWRGQLMLVQEDSAGRVLRATGVQQALALDALYAQAASARPLGLELAPEGRTPGRTAFHLWAPTAHGVWLCLYDDGDAAPARALRALRIDAASGIWSHHDPQDWRGRYYTYLVEVHVPGQGLVRQRVTDPYSISLGLDSRRSLVAHLDDAALKPPGWDAAPRPGALPALTDLVAYELHLRDFSMADERVRADWRGKYLAFTEPDSHGVRHLRRLAAAGITDIHLLPVFDLASVPERGCLTPEISGPSEPAAAQAAVRSVADRDCYNWGYDPWHFGAPEGSYASDAADGRVRLRELRAMVQALHALGLRVGMDLVYNHTSASGADARAVLDRIVPGYYHRLDARGAVERSTCCDNTATEHAMMERLMIDTAARLARDWRIDSFRFDLMGHQPRAAMQRLQAAVDAAAGRRIHLIGEGWDFGEVARGARFVQASQRSLGGAGIASFNDRLRDALRGGSAMDDAAAQGRHRGLLAGALGDAHAADLARAGLAGTLRDYPLRLSDGREVPLAELRYGDQPAGYAQLPGEVVNYSENHDNLTLFDALVLKLPRTTPMAERARVQVLGAAFVALAQGVAYLHAGQELLRSKSLDRNSYDSGDAFNRLDFSGVDNGFGIGLPRHDENGAHWPLLAPLLADPALKPTAADVQWTRDAVLDLLRIRAAEPLLRLRTAADVRHRLRLHNTGPQALPGLFVAHLDGQADPAAATPVAAGASRELLYAINLAEEPRRIALPALAGRPFVLHPVHRASEAADRRASAEARWRAAEGMLEVPARSAVVWQLPR